MLNKKTLYLPYLLHKASTYNEEGRFDSPNHAPECPELRSYPFGESRIRHNQHHPIKL